MKSKICSLLWLLIYLAAMCNGVGAIYINEILFNPPGSPDDPYEYIELRGTPNDIIDANTYLVAVDGGVGDVGKVRNIFPLSGLMIGNNGFLVLLQKNHIYTTAANAVVVTNSGTEGGWGDNNGSSLGHNGNNGATNMENPSVTFMLIESPVLPTPSDNVDSDNNGTLDHTGTNWTVLDAVGVLDNTGAGERAFGKINFRRNSAATAPNTIVSVAFTPSYVGRKGNTTGWASSDWVASDISGTAPNWATDGTKTVPAGQASKNLDDLGSANFGDSDLPGVKLVQSGNSTDVSEVGGTDTYTLELNKTPSGAVTIQISADSQIEISTNGGTTFSNLATLRFTATGSPKTVTVRAVDDARVETTPHTGQIMHSVISTADGTKYPLTSIVPTVNVKITDNDVALLSEVKVNPPGSPDATNEFIEIRGTANAVLTNLYLLALDGSGANKGRVDTLVMLNTNLGSSGNLIVVGNGHPYSIPGTTTIVKAPQFTNAANADGALRNDTLSILLISSPTSLTEGQDLDPTDSGSLVLPLGATIMDSIGWTDGDSGDLVYGGASLTQPTWTPDAATRFATSNAQNSATAWFCGELSNEDGSTSYYDVFKTSSNAPLGAALSPGNPNNNMPPTAYVPSGWSGVIGDPDNAKITFTVADAESLASSLTVSATSGSPSDLPTSRLSITGGSGVWVLDIRPTNICYDVPINIAISDGNSQTTKKIRYSASSGWTTNTHFYMGFGDSSAGVPLDDTYMLVADDETHPIRLVSRTKSGPALKQFDFSDQIGLTNRYAESGELYESDFEGATRAGDVAYWLSSQGNGGDGRVRPNRMPLVATRILGTGTNTSLTLVGYYNYLRQDLLEWDATGMHGKGNNYYGFVDSAANLHIPKSIDGFNIEGFTMALGQDNTNVALIGLRAPLVPIANRAKALIVTVTNLGTLCQGFTNAGHARFGESIELDLGGRSIRSIERYQDGYLIIAGPWGAPTGDPYEFRLFTWGGGAHQPAQEMSAGFSGLIPEGIVALSPGSLTRTSQVQVLSDCGVKQWYLPVTDADDKDLPESNFKKCRSDWVTIGDPVNHTTVWIDNTNAIRERFVRGTGTNDCLHSYVESLNDLKGLPLLATGGAEEFYPGNDWTETLYHYNAATPSMPLVFRNPIAAFGSEVGGTPLSVNRNYTFRIGFGDRPRSAAEVSGAGVVIAVYDRQTMQRLTNAIVNFSLDPWSQAEDFSREGIALDLPQYGLTTFIRPALNNTMDTDGFYISHRATKVEYLFMVGGLGYRSDTNALFRPTMVSNFVSRVSSPLYVVAFDRPPATRSDFVLQPHFEGEPLPPAYAGKTVEELLLYSATVTNQITVGQSAATYTNLDASPELRRHPMLDQFVADMGRDPIVLANYVQNEIKLIDAFTDADELSGVPSVNQGGMNRGAMATYLEGQGSPLEQCALLVYLLRQAGTPAVYVFPSHNSVKMLDSRLSSLLRFRLQSSTQSDPRLIPVNYPWVAAYDGTNWIHLFPWLKDTELVEGLDVYDYLPADFNNGYKWAREYLYLNSEIFQLGHAKDTPAELFPAFVQYELSKNSPGITLDDIGANVINRKHQYARWKDFPHPTLVTNQVFAVESMAVVSNTIPAMTNVFNTVSVQVTSLTNPATRIETGDIRILDLHNRRFALWYEPAGTNFHMILSLDSFRPDATNHLSFVVADPLHPTSAAVVNVLSATNTLISSDDILSAQFHLKRYTCLSFASDVSGSAGELPIPSRFQSVTPLVETTEERLLRKGDLAAICVNPGRMSTKMLQLHQERYDAVYAACQDASHRATVTADEYEGQWTYLMAAYYFGGVGRFTQICERLHKAQVNSWFSMALAIYGAERNASNSLPSGNITYAKAKLDVFFQELTSAGNGTLHSERAVDAISANDSFRTLLMLNSAAQEHSALDHFFRRSTAISAVTLLQKAMFKTSTTTGFGIVELTKANYLNEGEQLYPAGGGQKRLKELDPTIWNAATNAFMSEGISNSVRVLLTRGYVTNAVGSHFGGMLFGGKRFMALLSPVAINSPEWVGSGVITSIGTWDSSWDWQSNGWGGGFQGETFGSQLNLPPLSNTTSTALGPMASFGIQCKTGGTIKIYQGEDRSGQTQSSCAYHTESWFGDSLDKGDRVVSCCSGACSWGCCMPETMIVCCEDVPELCSGLSDTISLSDPRIQKYIQAYQAIMMGAMGGGKGDVDMAEGDEYSDYGYDYEMEDPEAYGYESNWDFSFNTIGGFDPMIEDYPEYYSSSDDPIPPPQPPAQADFNTQIQDTGFVGLEHFLDNINVNYSLVSDPVSIMTGEFYINEEDLVLNGPFPLSLRRTYSSRNPADNELGYGWNLNMFPYLTVTHSGKKIYTVTGDGSVISYRRDGNTTNWFPDLNDNKELVNQNQPGQELSVNMLTSRLTLQTVGTNSYYRIHLPNGSVKTYVGRKFRKSNVNRDRPYLTEWADNRGNTLTFSYGEDPDANDFGKMRRIESSGGNSLVLYYNRRGHITEVLSSDGKRVRYLYELTTGDDLVGVVRTDGSQVSYGYERQPVADSLSTNYVIGWTSVDTGNGIQLTRTLKGFNIITNAASTHRIIAESKPDGRFLQNFYDDRGCVTQQWATVGLDLRPIKTATFVYSNNFVRAGTNPVTGYTLILDVFGNTNRYDYTSNLITRITDPLNQSIVQEWYGITNGNGAYPRSIKSRTDKRGLKNEFVYDSLGNIVTNIITGADLTGDGVTSAEFSYTYNTNNGLNLLLAARNPIGRSVERVYDSTYTRLPSRIISYAGNIPVVTNAFFYTNAVTQTTYATNRSYGLLWRTVHAWLSPDASTNDFEFGGRGFATKTVQYSSTGDPDIIRYFYYNSRGDLVESTDAAGTRSGFAYDEAGRVTAKEIYAVGQQVPSLWEYTYYNANGEVVWNDGPRFDPEDYVWRDYDGAGRVTQTISWRSRARRDGTGVEAETGDNLYAATFNEYDVFGNLVRAVDPRGNYTLMEYDVVGRLTRSVSYAATGSAFGTNTFGYEFGGQVTVVTNALGGLTRKFYTSMGQLRRQENPDGSVLQYIYYPDGRAKRSYLSNGNYWETVYDDANRKVTKTFNADPANTAMTVFDQRGNAVFSTDPTGGVVTNFYDGLNRIKWTAGAPTSGGLSTQHVASYFYDATGTMLVVSNALGEKTVTTSDILGRPVNVDVFGPNAAFVRRTTTQYATNHSSVTVISGTGFGSITNREFTDTAGRSVLRQSFPSGGDMQFTLTVYDPAGNAVEQRDELNRVTTSIYDGLNRAVTNTLPDGAQIIVQYNAAGAATNRIMPGGLTWSATYDTAGRIVSEKESNAGESARMLQYDYFTSEPWTGLLWKITDARGVTKVNSYDALLRVWKTDYSGPLAEHNLHAQLAFDRRGRVTQLDEYGDNPAILPATSVKRAFDGYGQLTNEQVQISGTTVAQFTQTWDAVGRREALAQGAAMVVQGAGAGTSVGYRYRADGLMTSVVANNNIYNFSYDDKGLLISRSNSFRTTTVDQRDGRGRVRQQTTRTLTAVPLVENLNWRANLTLADYTATRPTFSDYQNYAYNTRGQLIADSFKPSASLARATNDYAFDAARLGVLTSVVQSGGLTGFWRSGPLDALFRVVSETNAIGALTTRATGLARGAGSVTAALDNNAIPVDYNVGNTNGNWSADLTLTPGSHTLVATAQHPAGTYQASATNSFSLTGQQEVMNDYDATGNLATRTFKDGRVQRLIWNAQGRLLLVTDKTGSATNYTWTAVYDGLGRRLRTTYNPGVTNSAAITIESIYDPLVEFQELAVAVNGQRTWKVMGPDLNGYYAGLNGVGGLESTVQENDGMTTGVINDRFGNVLATVVDSVATWNSTRVNGYGPVGGYDVPILSLSTTLADSLVWRTRRMDPTGFFYLGARYYDPVGRRFVAPDPLGHTSSADLYSFCGGDPANSFDADGMFVFVGNMYDDLNLNTPERVQGYMEGNRAMAPYAVAAGVTALTGGLAAPVFAGWGLSGGWLALATGGFSAGYGDLAFQGTRMAIGDQQSYNPNQTAVMVGTGGVLSLAGHGLGQGYEMFQEFLQNRVAASASRVLANPEVIARMTAQGATPAEIEALGNIEINATVNPIPTATPGTINMNSLLPRWYLDEAMGHEFGHSLMYNRLPWLSELEQAGMLSRQAVSDIEVSANLIGFGSDRNAMAFIASCWYKSPLGTTLVGGTLLGLGGWGFYEGLSTVATSLFMDSSSTTLSLSPSSRSNGGLPSQFNFESTLSLSVSGSQTGVTLGKKP
jgi:RHS repeat-associated protein